MTRRRRTDQLLPLDASSNDPLRRAQVVCEALGSAGFDATVAIRVPHAGGQGVVCASHGRVEPLIDFTRGFARQACNDGRALSMIDAHERFGLRRLKHAAIPIGTVREGIVVLVVSDSRLSQREGLAIAAWAAPSHVEGLRVAGGPCVDMARTIAGEFAADTVVFALFAQAGVLLQMHARSGGLLHACRVPADTVWGEVARHGAAFALGDLPMHPGAEMLASLGMQTAGLVGLENGHGIAIGALGVASRSPLDIDTSHRLLERAPHIGPQLMQQLSETTVPVPDADGTIDVGLLAARVGCRRFAMYERTDAGLELVAAHTRDGSRLVSPPDELERQLVTWAAQRGVGVVSDGAAAVLIGEHTVLYAHDQSRRALDCLRLALQDVRRNPFDAEPAADDDPIEDDHAA
jgi:hypothetical protein